MERANYKGAVRDSSAEQARDKRMLELADQGLEATVIAQRMGLTAYAVRQRIKRARALRNQDAQAPDHACG